MKAKRILTKLGVVTLTLMLVFGLAACDNETATEVTIKSVADVADVSVPYGTDGETAKGELDSTVEVTLSDDETKTADIAWEVPESYDAQTAGDYEFNGSFDLEAVEETGSVTATVTVEEEVVEEEYTVTFDVTPEDAVVTFDGSELEGNTVEVVAGEYNYSVALDGYDTETGTVEVVDEDVTEEVVLEETVLTVESVKAVEALEVENGTAFADLSLPEEVTVVLSDDSEEVVPVEWAEGNYDGDTAGDYTLEGTIDVSGLENVENTDGVKASVEVTVKPASLSVESVEAVEFDAFEVTFDKEVDEVGVDNFFIDANMGISSAEKTEADPKVVKVILERFLPEDATIGFRDLEVNGTLVSVEPKSVDQSSVEIPRLQLTPEEEEVAVNQDTDTASVEMKVDLVNFPENTEATVEFTSTYGQISENETTDGQKKSVRLTASDITEDKDAKVIVSIKEVKNTRTGELYPDYKEKISDSSQIVTFTTDVDSAEDEINSYTIVKAIANQADRVRVKLNNPLDSDAIVHMNNNLGQIEVTDNTETTDSIDVEKVVKYDDNELLVILDKDAANFPLTDNTTHNISFEDTTAGDDYRLQGDDDFYLEDSDYIELMDVFTSEDDDSLEPNQLKVIFSEAVNELDEDIADDDAEEYSVKNLENWVIDGLNLADRRPTLQATFPDDEISIDVVHTNNAQLTRDAVIITFEDSEDDHDNGDYFEDVKEFILGGEHNLQVNTIGDWASVTDDKNSVPTLNTSYQGITGADVEYELTQDSPEQFVIKFTEKVLPDQEEGIDNIEDIIEIVVPDKSEDAPYSDAKFILKPGEQVDADADADGDGVVDGIDATGNEISNGFTITELEEGYRYLIEINFDWTQLYDQDADNENYYMNNFNDIRFRVSDDGVYSGLTNSVGEKVTIIELDETLDEDTDSPEIVEYEVLNTVKDLDETDIIDEDVNEDGIITHRDEDRDEDIDIATDAGAVRIDFNEPIQTKDQYGIVDSTILTTPSQQQMASNGGVKEITFEYVSDNDSVEGVIYGVSTPKTGLDEERDFSIIVVPVRELDDANYKLVVRDVTDDIGNAMNTEIVGDGELNITTYNETVVEDEMTLDLFAADAHHVATRTDFDVGNEDSDTKDVVHVLFTKPMKITGDASVLKLANYRLNGEPIPSDRASIERGIIGEDDSIEVTDGDVTETIDADDVEMTNYGVTIILPDGYLQGRVDKHMLTIIDVEDQDGESISERVQLPYGGTLHPVD